MALIRLLPLGAAILLAACSTTQSIRPRENEPNGFAPWSAEPIVYHIGAGDRMKVDYLLTPELNEEVTVGPDGYVALRAAGRVAAQNLTPEELQARIAQAAARNLLHPVVTVGLTEARAARVVVGGQVRNPGVYPLAPRASVLEMVVQAGGLQPESRMNEVVVIRPRVGAPAMLRTVNLQRFVSRGTGGDSIALAPEDIIFVPRSRISEANLWVEENITKMVPFDRSVTYTKGSIAGTTIR